MVEWPGSSRNMPAKRWTAQLVQREIWSVLSYPSALRFSIFADPLAAAGARQRRPRESLESKNKKTRWTCKQGAEARGQEQVGGSPLFFLFSHGPFCFFFLDAFSFSISLLRIRLYAVEVISIASQLCPVLHVLSIGWAFENLSARINRHLGLPFKLGVPQKIIS